MALNGEESWLCLMCCNSDSESKDFIYFDFPFMVLIYGCLPSPLLRNCDALAHFFERALGFQKARLRERICQALATIRPRIEPRIEIGNGRNGSGGATFDDSNNSYKTRAVHRREWMESGPRE